MRRGDPSVGTAELGDQPALLRFLDEEEVREVQWETIESVFEEVIVIICLSVSVGGRKHKRLTSFYYPVIIVFLCFKRCPIFRL